MTELQRRVHSWDATPPALVDRLERKVPAPAPVVKLHRGHLPDRAGAGRGATFALCGAVALENALRLGEAERGPAGTPFVLGRSSLWLGGASVPAAPTWARGCYRKLGESALVESRVGHASLLAGGRLVPWAGSCWKTGRDLGTGLAVGAVERC